MRKCIWCGEPTENGSRFCDDLCERLYNDYEASKGPWHRYADQDRAKRELLRKKNTARSG